MGKYEDIVEKLELNAHPCEGGFFRRNFTSRVKAYFPNIQEERWITSAIYYLFGENSYSLPHYLEQDEIWHFYSGSPLELLLISDAKSEFVEMGSDILANQQPQVIIKAGTIFCAQMRQGGEYSLIGATLTPAFEYRDYHEVDIDHLRNKYPQYREFWQYFNQKGK